MQVLEERIQHISYVPSKPEPYYEPTGRELRPRPVGDENGVIVYAYNPICAVNYVSCLFFLLNQQQKKQQNALLHAISYLFVVYTLFPHLLPLLSAVSVEFDFGLLCIIYTYFSLALFCTVNPPHHPVPPPPQSLHRHAVVRTPSQVALNPNAPAPKPSLSDDDVDSDEEEDDDDDDDEEDVDSDEDDDDDDHHKNNEQASLIDVAACRQQRRSPLSENEASIEGGSCAATPFTQAPPPLQRGSRRRRRRYRRQLAASISTISSTNESTVQFSRSSVGGSKYLMSVNANEVTAASAAGTRGDLIFESRFESANLAKAVKITPLYYELYLRTDLYTNRSSQWFYFRVRNVRRGCTYRLSIVNLVKSGSLYNEGMRPLMYSTMEATRRQIGWHRCGENIAYFKNEDATP